MKRNGKSEEQEAQPVRFEFYDDTAQAVSIAGTFNHWQPRSTAMVPLGRGRWMRVLFLSPGRHEFNFVVDTRSRCDPTATLDPRCELVIGKRGHGLRIPMPHGPDGAGNDGKPRRE